MDLVIHTIERAERKLVEQFAALDESASIYEVMQGSAMSSDMRPVWPGTRMCGTALTVRTRPADNLMLHKAISMAQPGDVIVVDCGDYIEAGGMFGGLMAASMKQKGCAGLVTNGTVRDSMMIKKLELPVFSRGLNVKASSKCHGGAINHPVTICGVVVNPGDIIFGDNDAVVVIPREQAEEIYAATCTREKAEDEMLRRILAGEGVVYDFSYQGKYEALGLPEEA